MSVLEMVKAQAFQSFEQTNISDLFEKQQSKKTAELRAKLKKELVGRLGLKTISKMLTSEDEAHIREELKVSCEAILHTPSFESINLQDKKELIEEVIYEVCGLGPLQPLLDDKSITEIMVNGCHGLFFERGGHIYASQLKFESAEQIMVVLDRILAPLGRRIDQANPLVSARLANGDRVNAVAAPIAIDGPILTIRKFSNRITSLAELVELGSLPPWYAQLLSWAVKFRQDIAVAGGTGSGKTTLLNALSCEIKHEERIITIEDSAELHFENHPDVVRLETRDASREGSGLITIRDLVKNALRMRPDRIVVGEVRGEEAIDMLQAMNTGHDGSMTTLHAGTAQEAILRLVLMARFGMDLPAEIIEEQIVSALDLIVMSQRLAGGQRRITSLSVVDRKENGGVRLLPCITYDLIQDSWSLMSEPPFIRQAVEEDVISKEEVEKWRCLLP